MRLPYTVTLETEEFKRRVAAILNGHIDFTDNMFCRVIDVPDSGPADSSIILVHGLNRLPIGYTWNIDRAGIVYDFNRAAWTTVNMTLKCSVANAVLRLVIL